MLFDWFTFVAQIINFLILLVLLWRFLYKPILKTMDERQERLKSRWHKAHEKQEEAKKEAEAYRQKQQELQEKRSQLMAQAKEKARSQRQELVQQARQEVQEMQAGWRESIRREQKSFLDRLRQQVAEQTYDLTRRILRDVANADIEQQAIGIFLDRLDNLGQEDREAILERLQDSDEPIYIRSGFEISEGDRQQIFERLQQEFGKQRKLELVSPEEDREEESESENPPEQEDNKTPVLFVTTPRLICGISLQVAGETVTWTFHNYLQDLEERFSEFLQQETEKDKEKEPREKKEENIQRQIVEQTYAIARRALKDLADVDLEERVITVFLKRLEHLDESERKALAQSVIGDSDKQIVIRSSFDLSPEKRDQILYHLRQQVPLNDGQVEFTKSPTSICGIELQLGNRSIVWSLENYLDSLKERLAAAVKEEENETERARSTASGSR